jgi:hypothetical protein
VGVTYNAQAQKWAICTRIRHSCQRV